MWSKPFYVRPNPESLSYILSVPRHLADEQLDLLRIFQIPFPFHPPHFWPLDKAVYIT